MTKKKTSASNTPGERHRDEQRKGGPRQDGRQWHDLESPKDIEPEAMAGEGAAPDVESGGEHEGMGRGKATTPEEDRNR